MFTLLKYLPKIIFGFKDVSKQYKEETGEGRPWYLSRTFLYSALCFVWTLVTVGTGVELEKEKLDAIADNVTVIIPAVIALVSAILSFIAQFKRKPTSTKNDTPS